MYNYKTFTKKGEYLRELGLGLEFLDLSPKAGFVKGKLDLIEWKALFLRRAVRRVKRQAAGWGEILANHASDKGLQYKKNFQHSAVKSKQPKLKTGRRHEWSHDILHRRGHAGGRSAHERTSLSFAIREAQAKATRSYRHTPVRVAKLENRGSTKCW